MTSWNHPIKKPDIPYRDALEEDISHPRIHEDKTPAAVGILLTWVHPHRTPEASDTTIEQLNCLSDQDVVLALTDDTLAVYLSMKYI
ncbi:hypothetical protein PILCRDRAFT_14945 [Piloderma croceum F 1598]|uniref:Uncharacterized protein n=1 Tax=Piloderma croceum (strain F 1598) TaxID=765440 RepID=A0A0C3F0X1_PILCF|nr:hypothetical protein PILCRDRAFT_14945 [Piloderma croceum F 1598]